MSLVISSNMVLGTFVDIEIDPNTPRLCWRNRVTTDNVSATSAEGRNHPATNLANPSTAFTWKATSDADQTITVNTGGAQVDYLGFARHNLSTDAEIRVQFNGITNLDWKQVPDDQSILALLNAGEPAEVTLDIRNNPDPPKIAVLYVGLSMPIQRNIYVGHTPITYGTRLEKIGGISESGQYLGELITRETRRSQISFQNLTPDWYRENMADYLKQRPRPPFFWAWRPQKYPDEVGFVWVRGNPEPSNQRANGMMSVDLDIEGIA